jgi:hypothetical protein
MNNQNQISTISLSRLRQTEALSFFRMMLEIFKISDNSIILPLIEYFEKEINAFAKAVNPKMENAITEPLALADERRDTAIAGFFKQIKVMCKHFDADIKAAANRLQDIIKHYADIPFLPYIQENGKIDALLRDLSSERAVDSIAVTGTVDWLQEIRAANTHFNELFEKRSNEKAGIVSGRSTALRQACENAYRPCVDMFNSLVMVNGAEDYQSIIDKANSIIRYQKQVISARETTGQKRKSAGL